MRLAIGFAFVSFSLCAASGTRSDDWVADMREAIRLDQSAHYAEAATIYERILPVLDATQTLPPNEILRAELENALAAHYHRMGRYAEAEPLYRQAIEIWRHTSGPEALRNKALGIGNLAALERPRGGF